MYNVLIIICLWCGKNARLIKHHYPISTQDGGTSIIEICYECHSNYHYGILVNARDCKSKREIKEKEIQALKEVFPTAKCIINPVIYTLTPKYLWGLKNNAEKKVSKN